jgi:murein DD-endopeptidase MepM/ murein hydrolase activator NlpD
LIYVAGMKNVVLTLLFCLLAIPAFALELALPVACTVGTNCWIQQYADHDSSPGATDYSCGVASYDGHDGTDIRVLNASVKVEVVAAAAGKVKAVRDGVADNLVKTDTDKAAVDKTECGNGVVIDHGDGWETQYCHLRNGSTKVKAGDIVASGGLLGEIGFSGNAAFPHLHLTVRKDGKHVDPFSADTTTDCKASDRSLWTVEAQKGLAYKDAEVLQLTWAPKIYENVELEAGKLEQFDPTTWTALVLFAEVINLRKDDEMTLWVFMPGRAPMKNTVVMERNRAVQQLNIGRRLQSPWRSGLYRGVLEVWRGKVSVISKQLTFQIE